MAGLAERLPAVRGRLTPGRVLADLTWFRVGGPAELLFQPADAADLAEFLKGCPAAVPVTAIGVGSNLLVRDGGIGGVVIRVGRGFGAVETEGAAVIAGAAALDARVAGAAAQAGLAGLEFLRTIPGSIGGALAMNAGCYGVEVKDRLLWAEAVTRDGRLLRLSPAEMGFAYREARAAEGLVFTRAGFAGEPDAPEAIAARMAELLERREASQPLRSRTGGSTFRNPAGVSSNGDAPMPGHRAWELIDAAGCRGLTLGGAKVSEKHCNFLINNDNASAADLEGLGETVRARVKSASGVDLRWEIRRIGVSLQQ
ncbi:UDP-N-acetylmuramate dehydrogenase [Paralimibaculum aggregatum]|uniref:UDP-N-acetylenolpyruvoylglucosamine reductase n=1 Tax=Paralimibaculum aggregatum TaxID=3036245 RepID=A0ABQ6LH59_9RHOB|nr:UDP-N-acetylmuramate dehydrogenase [Limibaculum sp. NKW23]GMG82347.1 UDP-N-acetylmuramate dehydrogenase [Limibaculum sp. NKW23]